MELPPAVTEVGTKPAVTPLGSTLVTARATDSATPEVTAVLIVLVPAAPWATERLDGVAPMLKSFGTGAVTVRATDVVWVAEAAVPVIVTVTGPPMVAPPLAVRVRVELPPAVTEVGTKPAVTPLGSTLVTARATDSAEPETTAVLIVLVPAAPWATERLDGVALMLKSFVTGRTYSFAPESQAGP